MGTLGLSPQYTLAPPHPPTVYSLTKFVYFPYQVYLYSALKSEYMGRVQFLAIEFKPDSHWTLGANQLHFTAAGNLELSNVATGEVVWQTNTRGQRMAMQADGNLVVYGQGQDVLWASDTA